MLCDQGLIRIEIEAQDDLAHRRRCVVAGDLLQASQALPDTLLGLILARIDRLPREEQIDSQGWFRDRPNVRIPAAPPHAKSTGHDR